jgi:hypothetical protein
MFRVEDAWRLSGCVEVAVSDPSGSPARKDDESGAQLDAEEMDPRQHAESPAEGAEFDSEDQPRHHSMAPAEGD